MKVRIQALRKSNRILNYHGLTLNDTTMTPFRFLSLLKSLLLNDKVIDINIKLQSTSIDDKIEDGDKLWIHPNVK